MLVGALTSSAAKPDVADLLARARTIAEFARERAQQTETERRVGDDNAQWQLLGGMIPQGNGAAQPGFFLLRSGDCTIDDNWHAMGLAGTGSKNIVVHDAFVPFHRTLPFAELLDATAPGMRTNPN